ncbi:MAG: hypothetical protein ACE5MI_09450 [Acidimicrobiia bacterium]
MTITTEDRERTRTYTGHVVSRTDHTVTILVTAPYPMAGQSVTIEAQDIISERILAR